MSRRPRSVLKIFNLRYNSLAGLQVFFILINSVLLIQVFGVSANSDAYLLALSTFAALQLIQLMTVEQFMYFYSEIREKDPEDAFRFCNVVEQQRTQTLIRLPLFPACCGVLAGIWLG